MTIFPSDIGVEMDFPCVKKNGQLVYPSLVARDRLMYLEKQPEGARFKETLTRVRSPKTHQQVKTIFGHCIMYLITEFIERGWDTSYLLKLDKPTGVPPSKTLFKEYFYGVCPMEDDEGEQITLSDAGKEQVVEFIDNIMNHSSSIWGIYIPEPDPNWKEKILSGEWS